MYGSLCRQVDAFLGRGFGARARHHGVTNDMASTGGTRGEPRDAQRARALLDYLLETVTIFDRDGVVVYSTGDAHGVLRYEPGTVQGRHGFDYIHPEDRDWVIDAFQRILRPRMTEPRESG